MRWSVPRGSILGPLLPEAAEVAHVGGELGPRARHGRSAVVLLAVFVAWLAAWGYGNRGFLFDPMLQADDARTSLFPFHRYGPEQALKDDPIAAEMMASVPPFVHGVYRALTPAVGLFEASKVVQGLCLAILLGAGLLILRSPRGGLAPAIVLVFLVLHTTLILQRGISGGLPRAFAFPLFALWTAGAVILSERVRQLSVVLAALTYPSALLILLAAEGLFALRDGVHLRDAAFRFRLARYAILVVVAVGFVGLYLGAKSDAGHVQTLAEASQDPAFHKGGRLEALPFPNPALEFSRYFVAPFLEAGHSVLPGVKSLWPDNRLRFLCALPFVGIFAALVLLRRSPPPRAFLAFTVGVAIIYAVARAFAFHLYWPERYYSYGMPMAAILLAVETIGTASLTREESKRGAGRNLAALGVIVAVLLLAGDGIDPANNGMTIDGREHADLYAFARSLPVTSRVASHPMDGDDLPYWAARATMGGYETIQPWFSNAWRREQERTRETLAALYATDRDVVLRYCERHDVTHFLLRRGGRLKFWLGSGWIVQGDRYGADFEVQARLFEPFGSYVTNLVKDLRLEDLVLARPPETAIVFKSSEFEVVDVAKLREAWGAGVR